MSTDYRHPERKESSLHSQKFNPNPKFLGTDEAYFVCHISPIFQISLIYAFIGCSSSVLMRIWASILQRKRSDELNFSLKVTIQSSDEEPQDLFNVPDDKLFNNGWVANATEWQWEDIALPKIDSGSIVKVLGEFDRFQGVVGLDNIRVYTKQK